MINTLLQFFGLVMTRCYDDYGCYSLGGNYYSIYRPINVFPLSPETINVTFHMSNRRLYNDEQVFDYENNNSTLVNSAFCATCETKFVIHGFTESAEIFWIRAMTKELLRKGDYNVIVVDWKNGALMPYTQAVANARVIGAITAHFIRNVQSIFNVSAQSIHVIGHSLGAHIASYAGQEISGLGRITGLDPAKPYFAKMPIDVRLDPSDALFVDVIHTDIGNGPLNLDGIGYYEPMGHVDFYPNGGRNQPGCERSVESVIKKASGNIITTNEMMQYLMCNHMRSSTLFIESINSACPYLANSCDDWDKYKRGECFQNCGEESGDTENCSRLGFEANYPKANGTKFFLLTGDARPYCRYHYKVKIEVAEGHYGKLYVTLLGNDADTDNVLLMGSEIEYQSGINYTFVFGEKTAIGDVVAVALKWVAMTTPFNPNSWYLWHKPTMAIRELEVTSLENGRTFNFCFCGQKIKTGQEIVRNIDDSCIE